MPKFAFFRGSATNRVDRRDAIDITRLGLDGRARNLDSLGARLWHRHSITKSSNDFDYLSPIGEGEVTVSASALINDRMDLLARVVPRGLGLGGVNAAVVGLLLAALYNPVWTAASSTSSSAAVCTENL